MISIVIVNWNSGELLGRCLHSLALYAPRCETLVVDNASGDGSWHSAVGAKDVVLVRNDRNEGFAGGCNRGWRQSTGDPVLFLNPDAEATEGAIDALAAVLESRNEVWAAAGTLVDAGGNPQRGFNVRHLPTVASVAADALLIDEIWPGNPWSDRMPAFDHTRESEVEQPAAACLMLRRATLIGLGGFDESFHPAWFEDVDLSRRIHDAGGRILYFPRARFQHVGGTSLSSLPYRDFLWRFNLNRLRYFRKHHGGSVAERVRRLLVCGMVLRAALSLVIPRPVGINRTSAACMYWDMARRLRPEAVP